MTNASSVAGDRSPIDAFALQEAALAYAKNLRDTCEALSELDRGDEVFWTQINRIGNKLVELACDEEARSVLRGPTTPLARNSYTGSVYSSGKGDDGAVKKPALGRSPEDAPKGQAGAAGGMRRLPSGNGNGAGVGPSPHALATALEKNPLPFSSTLDGGMSESVEVDKSGNTNRLGEEPEAETESNYNCGTNTRVSFNHLDAEQGQAEGQARERGSFRSSKPSSIYSSNVEIESQWDANSQHASQYPSTRPSKQAHGGLERDYVEEYNRRQERESGCVAPGTAAPVNSAGASSLASGLPTPGMPTPASGGSKEVTASMSLNNGVPGARIGSGRNQGNQGGGNSNSGNGVPKDGCDGQKEKSVDEEVTQRIASIGRRLQEFLKKDDSDESASNSAEDGATGVKPKQKKAIVPVVPLSPQLSPVLPMLKTQAREKARPLITKKIEAPVLASPILDNRQVQAYGDQGLKIRAQGQGQGQGRGGSAANVRGSKTSQVGTEFEDCEEGSQQRVEGDDRDMPRLVQNVLPDRYSGTPPGAPPVSPPRPSPFGDEPLLGECPPSPLLSGLVERNRARSPMLEARRKVPQVYCPVKTMNTVLHASVVGDGAEVDSSRKPKSEAEKVLCGDTAGEMDQEESNQQQTAGVPHDSGVPSESQGIDPIPGQEGVLNPDGSVHEGIVKGNSSLSLSIGENHALTKTGEIHIEDPLSKSTTGYGTVTKTTVTRSYMTVSSPMQLSPLTATREGVRQPRRPQGPFLARPPTFVTVGPPVAAGSSRPTSAARGRPSQISVAFPPRVSSVGPTTTNLSGSQMGSVLTRTSTQTPTASQPGSKSRLSLGGATVTPGLLNNQNIIKKSNPDPNAILSQVNQFAGELLARTPTQVGRGISVGRTPLYNPDQIQQNVAVQIMGVGTPGTAAGPGGFRLRADGETSGLEMPGSCGSRSGSVSQRVVPPMRENLDENGQPVPPEPFQLESGPRPLLGRSGTGLNGGVRSVGVPYLGSAHAIARLEHMKTLRTAGPTRMPWQPVLRSSVLRPGQ